MIYELLWTRMIVAIIGAAPLAVSIVLTIFMAGLGVGSFIGGRFVDRVQEPGKLLSLYGVLELVIGCYNLLLPVLLLSLAGLVTFLYNVLFHYFIIYHLLILLGCALILSIPVICMGATLPILCRFYVTNLKSIGKHVGLLYGLNTVGAALGAFLCGFYFIGWWGLYETLILTLTINIIIGLVSLWIGRIVRNSGSGEDFPAAQERVEMPELNIVRRGALLIFAVSGFCALACEVIWTRLLELIVGPTTYSLTLVLVTFIVGLAFGSMIFGWLGDRLRQVFWLLVFSQIFASIMVLITSQLLGSSQVFFAKLIHHFQDNFEFLCLLKAALLFMFMVFPTLLFGATFPLVGKIYTSSVSTVGRSIGFAYLINTVGAVLGSFCAGFFLIPFLGKEKSISLLVIIQILTAVGVGFISLRRRSKARFIRSALISCAILGCFLAVILPHWDHSLLSQGKYHRLDKFEVLLSKCGWGEALLHGSRLMAPFQKNEMIYSGDGLGGFTTILRYPDPFGNLDYSLFISGKSDASNRGDINTQTLMAHVPLLLHPRPREVMVLGLATGITAAEVVLHNVAHLDILEISREVVRASSYFNDWNNNVLSHPKANLIIQDGRTHLQHTRKNYDVIISEPSNPWMAGLATLYTRDFFELARARLNEKGIFVQFTHAYQTDWENFALIGRTFARVFPENMMLLTNPAGYGNDYMLIGFKDQKQ
ncbi:fused MFS/spermidine synthase, partial [candidate division CSSED10-310 bacterium]